NGYTLDAGGALQLIKTIEPKVVIPVHYADGGLQYPVEQQSLDVALKNLGMEVRETTGKFRYKPAETGTTTQLIVLTRAYATMQLVVRGLRANKKLPVSNRKFL